MTHRIEYLHAASGLLFLLTMIAGWFFVAANGMPDLSSADAILRAYQEEGSLLPTSIFVMTVGFFFSLWFVGVLLGKIHAAEGAGPLMWIAAGGAFTFIGVHTIAATWGVLAAATSLWMLRDLRDSQPRTSKEHGGDARPGEAS